MLTKHFQSNNNINRSTEAVPIFGDTTAEFFDVKFRLLVNNNLVLLIRKSDKIVEGKKKKILKIDSEYS
ncbi:hypothetical protein DERP_010463 [Dermatophagoides pteronyssinus]|uniref:Uncharacterized protein n=1 Tax=Dermatophagoides pteronyssinus TaxID=6956 RepID=A0ABQ8J550_DERPT|nr:hypothetical protein DERP_010463 [Dermatophagoides pteronyssinus]